MVKVVLDINGFPSPPWSRKWHRTLHWCNRSVHPSKKRKKQVDEQLIVKHVLLHVILPQPWQSQTHTTHVCHHWSLQFTCYLVTALTVSVKLKHKRHAHCYDLRGWLGVKNKLPIYLFTWFLWWSIFIGHTWFIAMIKVHWGYITYCGDQCSLVLHNLF